MTNMFNLAEKFVKLVESDSNPDETIKLAKRENRKMLEKKLRDAKQTYDARRVSLQGKRKIYEDMASVIDKETGEMNEAKKYMQKAYGILQNMDLVDAHEVRIFPNSDDVGFVKNHRIYRLKLDDNGEIELEPFRKKQLPPDDNDLDMAMDDDDGAEQDLLDADELLTSLID